MLNTVTNSLPERIFCLKIRQNQTPTYVGVIFLFYAREYGLGSGIQIGDKHQDDFAYFYFQRLCDAGGAGIRRFFQCVGMDSAVIMA